MVLTLLLSGGFAVVQTSVADPMAGGDVIVVRASDGDAPGAAAPSEASAPAPKEPGEAEEKGVSAEKQEIERLRRERDRIAAENALASERVRQELATLEAEKQRLQLENSLRTERLNAEVAETRTRLDRITLETEAINKQSALEAATRRSELDRELAVLRSEEERSRVSNAIAAQKTEARMSELRMLDFDNKVRRAELEMEVVRLQNELNLREKTEILRDLAPGERVYVSEPFNNGVLRVSDRRIELNGVIVPAAASHVADRIDYFNNQSTEYPIFLVIDSSPGGSVTAGDKIIKAMQGSQAPVYVVLKTYAASMAAVITASAPRSFAYPNAVIVHHQISWLGMGNLTQQREQLQSSEEWWRRLATPVARKMGLTLDQFIAEMYKKNSDGNWREFADTGVALKWVDHVVDTIWETSVNKNPDRYGAPSVITISLEERLDERGQPYVVLPRTEPHDCYFLHNPDRYYRLR